MKLVVVSPHPPEISGVGQYGAHVSAGLAHAGPFREVVLLANRWREAPAAERLDGVVVRRIWTRDWAGTPAAILSAVREERPHAVWFNLGLTVFGRTRWANFLGLSTPMFVKRLGLPTVVTLHEILESTSLRDLGAVNGRFTQWGGRAATRLLLQADAVCLTLQQYITRVARDYGVRNLHHIPHGIFAPPERLPLPNPHREALIFGTFAPYKGLPVMLDAFRRLRERDPELLLTVAGGDHPRFPGYLRSVRAAAGDLPGVRWVGVVPEPQLRELFARASVVVLPNTATTGASSVLHRAAGFGRPVVASDLPDIRALTEEEGLLVEFAPPGDAARLAEALAQLLADRGRRLALAEHNLRVMQTMTLGHTCARYADLLQAVAA